MNNYNCSFSISFSIHSMSKSAFSMMMNPMLRPETRRCTSTRSHPRNTFKVLSEFGKFRSGKLKSICNACSAVAKKRNGSAPPGDCAQEGEGDGGRRRPHRARRDPRRG
jgi:hypothetical protein